MRGPSPPGPRTEGIDIVWHGGAETDFVEQLTSRETAIVVGGFTTASPWTSEDGYSLEIAPVELGGEPVVVLVAPGENALLFSLDRAIGSLPGRSQ